jgi:hypothetical protein
MMANVERMFQVIVLGGIALVPVASSATGCGGAVSPATDAGSHGDSGGGSVDSGFPQEGRPPVVDSGVPHEAAVDSGFPQETAVAVDSGNGDTAFPQEGPAQVDSGFPQECAPSTCPAQGASCGLISDGCGGVLNCGPCVGAQSCIQGQCVSPDSGVVDGGSPG